MKNYLILFLFIFNISFLLGQQKVFETNKAFLKPKKNSNESFALSDQINGNLMIITSDNKLVKGTLLDANYNNILELSGENISSKYEYIIGYSISDGIYSILYSNSIQTKFVALQFDIHQKTVSEKKIKLKFNRERYVQSVVHANNLYIFTVERLNSSLKLFSFDEEFNPILHEIDLLEVEEDLNKNNKRSTSLYHLFLNSRGAIPYVDIGKIDTENHNTLEATSRKVKFYHHKNKVLFTFDQLLDKTKVVEIDLNSITKTITDYVKPDNNGDYFEKNNSFLHEDRIYHLACSKEKFLFFITDLNTKKLLKKFEVLRDDLIPFKNYSITQEDGGLIPFLQKNRTRELEKTSQFIHKLNHGDLGISVCKIDNNYNIVLGAANIEMADTAKALIALGAAAATLGAINAAGGIAPSSGGFGGSNTVYGYNDYLEYNYYNYTPFSLSLENPENVSDKSVFINCYFDKDLEHVSGDIPLNKFDLIKDFESQIEKPRAINIFRHQDKLHYNYLDKNNGKFGIYEF